MTASPTAVPPSPPTKAADGGTTLAALFAAAAASSVQRQLSANNNREQQQQPQRHQKSFAAIATASPTTNNNNNAASTKTKQLKKQHQQPGAPEASATKQKASDNVSNKTLDNSAANLIASLLKGGAKNLLSSTQSSSSFSAPKSVPSPSSSSLPLTKTTATYTTTFAKQPPQASVTTNATLAKSSSLLSKQNVSTEIMPNNVELRNLESWHDESEGKLDDSCYQELVDSGNTNGWSADEMFKYNEKRHKILSSYSEKTLSGEYTTPVPKVRSKPTLKMASKLAKEIEDRVIAEGRVTPESSDDDELFERERTKRIQMKQLKQLDQLKNLKTITNGINHSQTRHSTNGNTTTMINKYFASTNTGNYQSVNSGQKSNRSSSQHSNSSATPATASLSSSPTLNDSNMIMKPVASSSRNILRTCLT